MAKANNTVFVIRGTEGNETIVRTFRATERTKDDGSTVTSSPLKEAKKFLRSIATDEASDLHAPLLAGELSYVGGHPVQVRSVTQPTIVGL